MNNPVMEVLREEIDKLKRDLDLMWKSSIDWENKAKRLSEENPKLKEKIFNLELECRRHRAHIKDIESMLAKRKRKEELTISIIGLQNAMRPLLDEWSEL